MLKISTFILAFIFMNSLFYNSECFLLKHVIHTKLHNSQYHNFPSMKKSNDIVGPTTSLSSSSSSSEVLNQPPRIIYASLWIGLLAYTYFLSPGGSIEASSIDTELIMKMISTPFDGVVNPIFVVLFNALGIIPAILASLLLPGSANQKVPALPFVISSFALGFFGIGPYLGLRSINTDVTSSSNQGYGANSFEFKGISFGFFAFGLYLSYYLLSHFNDTTFNEFQQLFTTQRLVHVSTIDFTILSLAMWDPLKEDIQRRYSDPKETLPAWIYCVIPVLGPVGYLLTRPPLPPSSPSS